MSVSAGSGLGPHHLAKVRVAGSSPVARSDKSAGQGSNAGPGFTSETQAVQANMQQNCAAAPSKCRAGGTGHPVPGHHRGGPQNDRTKRRLSRGGSPAGLLAASRVGTSSLGRPCPLGIGNERGRGHRARPLPKSTVHEPADLPRHGRRLERKPRGARSGQVLCGVACQPAAGVDIGRDGYRIGKPSLLIRT